MFFVLAAVGMFRHEQKMLSCTQPCSESKTSVLGLDLRGKAVTLTSKQTVLFSLSGSLKKEKQEAAQVMTDQGCDELNGSLLTKMFLYNTPGIK